jgi:hypothetical protein
VVACLGMSRAGEPGGSSQVILVIRGPKGRRMECVMAMKRERSVRWVISILVMLLLGLDGGDSDVELGLVSKEGVSDGDIKVLSVCSSFLSSMIVSKIVV